MKIVILGLSLSSSWGNGHATTFRGLVRAMARRGHRVVFLERDVPWYADNRDLPEPDFCDLRLYKSLDEVKTRFRDQVAEADLVMLGSFVPEGIEVAEWVADTARGRTAFYDIDTPVTLAGLRQGQTEYLAAWQVPRFSLYLSFTGGPTLRKLEEVYGAKAARPLYCAVDPELYRPVPAQPRWLLGYMGTYTPDRQPGLECLMLRAARRLPESRFVVAGPQFPEGLAWPSNLERIEHLPPSTHPKFYSSQAFTLNLTRQRMMELGHSPSVRLFEAASCGVPILTDVWDGLEEFFVRGEEILWCRNGRDVLEHLRLSSERRRAIGEAARRRVLKDHTPEQRVASLERYLSELALPSGVR